MPIFPFHLVPTLTFNLSIWSYNRQLASSTKFHAPCRNVFDSLH